MSRYIDDKKAEILDTLKDINYAYNDCSMYDTLERLLNEMTADVVEVVYCEDCKHKEHCSQNIAMFGKRYDMYEAIHYCSYGERRNDE